MIPQPYITEWSTHAPWPTESQIEQDLILSRLIIEIASDELLANELAFRGGTCLHIKRTANGPQGALCGPSVFGGFRPCLLVLVGHEPIGANGSRWLGH